MDALTAGDRRARWGGVGVSVVSRIFGSFQAGALLNSMLMFWQEHRLQGRANLVFVGVIGGAPPDDRVKHSSPGSPVRTMPAPAGYQYDHPVRIARRQFPAQIGHLAARDQLRMWTFVLPENHGQVRVCRCSDAARPKHDRPCPSADRSGLRAEAHTNMFPTEGRMTSASIKRTRSPRSAARLMARLMEENVLPSPGNELVTMIRLLTAGRGSGVADLLEQSPLDAAKFVGDHRGHVVGRDHSVLAQGVEIEADLFGGRGARGRGRRKLTDSGGHGNTLGDCRSPLVAAQSVVLRSRRTIDQAWIGPDRWRPCAIFWELFGKAGGKSGWALVLGVSLPGRGVWPSLLDEIEELQVYRS